MGSIMGGPQLTKVPPPTSLFPGMQQSYINALQQSGINTAALNTLTQAATTGLPTDVGPAFDAFKAAQQQTIQQGAAGLQERLGRGMATGSDLVKGQSMYAEQTAKDLNAQLQQWSMAAQEAAANRRMGAAQAGAQLFAEPALGFAPSAVVSGSSGMLGGISSLFKTLFPNVDVGGALGGLFGGGALGSDVVANLPGAVATGDVMAGAAGGIGEDALALLALA